MNKTRFLYITVMLILADINSWYIIPVSTHPPPPPSPEHTHTHTPLQLQNHSRYEHQT